MVLQTPVKCDTVAERGEGEGGETIEVETAFSLP